MKQFLIRPPKGMTGLHVGNESVRFANDEPEWVGTQLAIALLGRGAANEGERDSNTPEPDPIIEPEPPEIPVSNNQGADESENRPDPQPPLENHPSDDLNGSDAVTTPKSDDSLAARVKGVFKVRKQR